MEIKILASENEYVVYSEEPVSFFDAMKLAGLSFYRPCGGIGRCLRCGVQFVYGAPAVNEYDDREYDHKQLNDGWRIGCKCTIDRDCKIIVPVSLTGEIETVKVDVDNDGIDDSQIGVAVDIGTTTLAIALVNLESGKTIGVNGVANSQIKYGADVVSRIASALDGNSEGLANEVRESIKRAVGEVTQNASTITNVVVSGNTTMMHLFLGFPVDGLAAYPFKPYDLGMVTAHVDNVEIKTVPSASAFIGGDIISGIYVTGMIESKEKSILLDLGTNAEVVLWDGRKLWATSSSAGPALEGGNISCGVPSVSGAISHVNILSSGTAAIETIYGGDPIGICGSGIIDTVAELYAKKIIDRSGLFVGGRDSFSLTADIKITAEDIQQVLLAKSAIYSSIEVLLNEAGLDASDIDTFYISGGMGSSINTSACVKIGLFPEAFVDKVQPVGNTSLQGAIKLLLSSEYDKLQDIIDAMTVVELANNKDFQALFLDNLIM